MVEVVVRDNNVDQALRVLKKKMQREGIYREMKMRMHYEKPSENNIDDSKALDEETRAFLYNRIMKCAQVGVVVADVARIDRYNILNATLWAMQKAIGQLEQLPRLVIVDGNRAPRLAMETRTIVKGDAKCVSIAAASIVAKVTRDRMMMSLARDYPGYGFERHKGYGTPEHQVALEKLGVCALHRRSFKPVQLALGLLL